MKKIVCLMMLCLFSCLALAGCGVKTKDLGGYKGIDVPSPEWVGRLEAAENADRLFIVAAFSEDATDAWVSLHEKQPDGTWHMVMTTRKHSPDCRYS